MGGQRLRDAAGRHFILKILFLSALPFCLYTSGRSIDNLERDFIAPVPASTPLLPVQGDFAGTGGTPKLLAVGRKGQLVALDFFAQGAPNHNIVCGAHRLEVLSGQLPGLQLSRLRRLVRIIDIGGSYKKIASMLGAATWISSPAPRSASTPSPTSRAKRLKSVTAVFAQMAYSNSDTDHCDDTELNMMRNAVR